MQRRTSSIVKQCANEACQAVEHVLYEGNTFTVQKWSISPSTGLCAQCLYEKQAGYILKMAWQFAPDQEEYEAIAVVANEMEERGVQGMQAQIVAEIDAYRAEGVIKLPELNQSDMALTDVVKTFLMRDICFFM